MQTLENLSFFYNFPRNIGAYGDKVIFIICFMYLLCLIKKQDIIFFIITL